jgi:cAMP-specific phosphodiesterase 4
MENMHVAQTFKLLSKEQYNILDLLKPEEYRLVRRRMIESVLATDMALHAKTLSTLKSKAETFDIKNGHNVDRMIFPDNLSKTYENQQTILSMILHSADISNPAKPNHIQKTWVDLVFIEFFKQGDLEKKNNLPVSLLCDRDTTNIDKSQVGFMSFVVIPSFETLLNFIPEIYQFMECIKYNLKKYEDMTKQENK